MCLSIAGSKAKRLVKAEGTSLIYPGKTIAGRNVCKYELKSKIALRKL